jgi:hypothetical protein
MSIAPTNNGGKGTREKAGKGIKSPRSVGDLFILVCVGTLSVKQQQITG